jgi:hypothetical protein
MSEIVNEWEATLRAAAAANHKTSAAASRYQAKLRAVQDQTKAAKELPLGAERARRVRSADRKRAEAARVYQDSLMAANEAKAASSR